MINDLSGHTGSLESNPFVESNPFYGLNREERRLDGKSPTLTATSPIHTTLPSIKAIKWIHKMEPVSSLFPHLSTHSRRMIHIMMSPFLQLPLLFLKISPFFL